MHSLVLIRLLVVCCWCWLATCCADDVETKQLHHHTWRIESHEPLRRLRLEVPGAVFVNSQAPEADTNISDGSAVEGNATAQIVAEVRVTASSKAMLAAVSVQLDGSPIADGLCVAADKAKHTLEGLLLVEVHLSTPHQLEELIRFGSGVASVGSGVLALDARNISIVNIGGELFAQTSARTNWTSLWVSAAGNGLVQLRLADVNAAQDVRLNLAGDGVLALITDTGVHSSRLEAGLVGSGRVIAQAKTLNVSKLVVGAVGTGIVSVVSTEPGGCEDEHVWAVGSARVASGSVACQNATVNVWGPSDAYVHVEYTLTASTHFSGHVWYVGARPQQVHHEGLRVSFPGWPAPDAFVHHAQVDRIESFTLMEPPRCEPLQAVIVARMKRWLPPSRAALREWTEASMSSFRNAFMQELPSSEAKVMLSAPDSSQPLRMGPTDVACAASICAFAAYLFVKTRLRRTEYPYVRLG